MKLWKYLAVGLLLCAGFAFGQTTAPTPVAFKINDILYPDTSDTRLSVKVPPYVRVEPRRGKIVYTVRTDSTELDSLSKGQPRVWTLVVRTKTAQGGAYRISFRRSQEGYGTIGTWPDTTIYIVDKIQINDVFPGVDYTFFAGDSMSVNDSVRVWLLNKEFASATADGKIDVNATLAVALTPDDTVTIVSGDTLIIKIAENDTTYIRIARNDSVFTMPQYPIDTLTIATYDTSSSKADTEYTSAFRGDRGYVTIFLDATTVTGTGTIIGIGTQIKRKGSTLWYPGSVFSKNLIVSDSIAFHDSLYSLQLSVPPADSVRLDWWSMRPAMKAVMKTIHAIWRD